MHQEIIKFDNSLLNNNFFTIVIFMSNVGFIGVGYMGYGMAKNLIKDFDVYIIAHKNREPIDKLIKEGATEVFSYKELLNLNHHLEFL